MEDFQLDIVVGKGPAASSIRLTLPPFTLVGATTRTGMITGPLRDRFGLVARLDFYDTAELEAIVVRAAGILDVQIDDAGAWEIARRSGGRRASPTGCCGGCATSPRCAATGRSTRRRRRRACACSASTTAASTRSTGRSSARCASSSAADRSGCRRVAISVGEQPETVEDVYEPFLIQQGLLARTPRGRVAMPAAYDHLGLHRPPPGRPAPRACSTDGSRIRVLGTSVRAEAARTKHSDAAKHSDGENGP